jgi:UDP-3-O-[3-hydroxymyristoyl] glucosamine N-acyltransferase
VIFRTVQVVGQVDIYRLQLDSQAMYYRPVDRQTVVYTQVQIVGKAVIDRQVQIDRQAVIYTRVQLIRLVVIQKLVQVVKQAVVYRPIQVDRQAVIYNVTRRDPDCNMYIYIY